MSRPLRCGHESIIGCVFLCEGRLRRGMVHASSTTISLTSGPPMAPTLKANFREVLALWAEFTVPRWSTLVSPWRPKILSAKSSTIREAWLPESRRAYVCTAPLGVCTLMGTIWSSAEVSNDDVPTKTGAAPWISRWCVLLQFSILHRPWRLHDFANWARWLMLRALNVPQSSMLYRCEQIEQGIGSAVGVLGSPMPVVRVVNGGGLFSPLIGGRCLHLFPPGWRGSLCCLEIGFSATEALARTLSRNQKSKSCSDRTFGLISIFFSSQRTFNELGSLCTACVALLVASKSLLQVTF